VRIHHEHPYETASRKKDILKKGYTLLNTSSQKEAPIITHLMTVTRLISECLTSNIGKHAKEIAKK
jgi:hypothetical protein